MLTVRLRHKIVFPVIALGVLFGGWWGLWQFRINSAESVGYQDAVILASQMEVIKEADSRYPDKKVLLDTFKGLSLGFFGDHTDFYLSPEDIPSKYQGLISQDLLPFVRSSSYRAILSSRNPITGDTHFWALTGKKSISKLDATSSE